MGCIAVPLRSGIANISRLALNGDESWIDRTRLQVGVQEQFSPLLPKCDQLIGFKRLVGDRYDQVIEQGQRFLCINAPIV